MNSSSRQFRGQENQTGRIVRIVQKKSGRVVDGDNRKYSKYLVQWEDGSRSWQPWAKVGPSYYSLAADFELQNTDPGKYLARYKQSRKATYKGMNLGNIDSKNICIDDIVLEDNNEKMKYTKNVYQVHNRHKNREFFVNQSKFYCNQYKKKEKDNREQFLKGPRELQLVQEKNFQEGKKADQKKKPLSQIILDKDSDLDGEIHQQKQFYKKSQPRMTVQSSTKLSNRQSNSQDYGSEEEKRQEMNSFIIPFKELVSPQLKEQQMPAIKSRRMATVDQIINPYHRQGCLYALPVQSESSNSPPSSLFREQT